MIKLMMVLTLFFTLQVHAVDEATCIAEGEQHLRPSGSEPVNPGCKSLFQSLAREVNKFESEDGRIVVHGHKNFIFSTLIDDSIVPEVISEPFVTGEQSELLEIHFLEVDEANRFITVLANDDNSILNFRLDKGGNVGWIRKLSHPDLASATAITTDAHSGHLLVLHRSEGKIVFYKRFADINGRTFEFTTEVLGELNGANTLLVSPVDACLNDSLSELYVFDGNSNQIHVYEQGSMGDISPKRTITPSTLPPGPVVKMDCHNSSSKLKLSDNNGNFIFE